LVKGRVHRLRILHRRKIMRKIFAVFIILILVMTLDAYALDGSAASFGADLNIDEKESIIKLLGVPDSTPGVGYTFDEENKYLAAVIKEDRLGSKAVIAAYVEGSGEGQGINVDISNLSYTTPEMITGAMITAGIKDVSVKIASPYMVSGSSSLIPIIKAYEKLTGQLISDEAKMTASSELAVMSTMGLKMGMQKSMQFMTEVKKEVIKDAPSDAVGLTKIIEEQEARFNIKLDDEEKNNMVYIMEKIVHLDLALDSISVQQKNISSYVNDLSKTAYENGFLEILRFKVMMVLKKVSMFFKNR
jgi:uncharacterized protein YpuA (DUF1002 family)